MAGCMHRTEDGYCRLFSDKYIKTPCVEGPCPYEKNEEKPRRAEVKKKRSVLHFALFVYSFSLIIFGFSKQDLICIISGNAGLIIEFLDYCAERILDSIRESKEDTEGQHEN